MASLNFSVRGKSSSVEIGVRVSVKRGIAPSGKTGYFVNPKDWSTTTKLPKTSTKELKELKLKLLKLETFILKSVDEALENEELINSDWLKSIIKKSKRKTAPAKKSASKSSIYLADYCKEHISRLKAEKLVSEPTIKKRQTILNKILSYEKLTKKKLKITDIDLKFKSKFLQFLDEHEKLASNTAGRYLKEVKGFALDAQKNGYAVSEQLVHIFGHTVEVDSPIFNFEELEILESVELKKEYLKTTLDWLIIGCFTGQRVSDLLRMNKSMITEQHGFRFITLTQVKGKRKIKTSTTRKVTIPLHEKVEVILKKYGGEFPPLFATTSDSNSTMFNRYLKELSKVAGFNQLIDGKIFDEEEKRFIYGKYPKYTQITTHICRRSFATNFYSLEKYPTPLLMAITGHSTENNIFSTMTCDSH